MDSLNRTVQFQTVAKLGQRHIRTLAEHGTQLATVRSDNDRLATGMMMTWTDIPGPPPLLQQLFYHAFRDPKPTRDILPGPVLVVVRGQDPFTQVQRCGFHAQTIPRDSPNGYSFI